MNAGRGLANPIRHEKCREENHDETAVFDQEATLFRFASTGGRKRVTGRKPTSPPPTAPASFLS